MINKKRFDWLPIIGFLIVTNCATFIFAHMYLSLDRTRVILVIKNYATNAGRFQAKWDYALAKPRSFRVLSSSEVSILRPTNEYDKDCQIWEISPTQIFGLPDQIGVSTYAQSYNTTIQDCIRAEKGVRMERHQLKER